MQLPAFFGHKRSINLLPRDEFEVSTIGVVLSWAMVFGKWAVIVTQLIVMGTFLWRFNLDRELTDLRKEIAKEVAIVRSYDQVERDFVLAQKQLKQLDVTLQEQERIIAAIDMIEQVTPQDVWYERMSLNPEEISLTAYASTLTGFGQFLTNVQANPMFSQVRIGRIESSNVRGTQMQFEITMKLKAGEKNENS